jgi:hypothetical protein
VITKQAEVCDTDFCRIGPTRGPVEDACYVFCLEPISSALFPRCEDPKMPDGPQVYSLQSGRLEVHWNKEGKTVDYIYAIHGKDFPTAKADEPERLAREARELADADRAIVLEFLGKMRDTLTARERTWIRELLERSNGLLRWTEGERRKMLGDGK